jgi:hypothetical protein
MPLNLFVYNSSYAQSVIKIFLYFNFDQQSEFTFYKLMLWLLQYHDEKSSSGESSESGQF